MTLPLAEDAPHDLGAKTAAAHPEQIHTCHPVGLNGFGNRVYLRHPVHHRRRKVQPAEPVGNCAADRPAGRVAPDRHVAAPDSGDDILCKEVIQSRSSGVIWHIGQYVALPGAGTSGTGAV